MNSLNVDETNPIIKSNSSEVETIYDTDNGDWEEMMNGNIFKKIIKQGTGETASMGTIVKCNLKGYIQDITNSSIASDNQPFEILKDQMFKIGESDAFPGLELTLRHAKVGEIFIVRCSSRFGFGPVQRPEIKQADGSIISTLPADSDLKYEVEVYAHVNFAESIDPLSVSPERDIALAESTLRKDCGNRWFSYADFNRAGRAYSKGVEVAEGYLKRSEVSEGDDRSEQPVSMGQLDPGGMLMNMYITCMNNLAATLLSKGEYLKAKEVATRVIEISPNNVKALLRAAKAALSLHSFDECEICLHTVLELEPDNTAAMKENMRLKAAVKEYNTLSKEMAQRMTKAFKPSTNKNSISSPSPNSTAGTTATTATVIHSHSNEVASKVNNNISSEQSQNVSSVHEGSNTTQNESNIVDNDKVSVDLSSSSSSSSSSITTAATMPTDENKTAETTHTDSNTLTDTFANTDTGTNTNKDTASIKPSKNTVTTSATTSTATATASSVAGEKRGWPIFLQLFISIVVVLLSIAFGIYFTNIATS